MGLIMIMHSLSRHLLLATVLLTLSVPSVFAQEARPVDRATFDEWFDDLSNWGRWGEGDQLGTLNLITPAVRKEAASLVREGVPVSMAHEVILETAPDASSPLLHSMVMGIDEGDWVVDRLDILFHGYAHTHIDALCHRFHNGQMYNGYTRQEISPEGCEKLSVSVMQEGIFTRGILMDIPRLKEVEFLEPGTAIYADDLEAWEAQTGITVKEGDALLIRTGRWARRDRLGPWVISESSAGLHVSAVEWLHERGVSILGSDAGSDVFPSGVEGHSHPVHILTLVALGMPILDNLDLEAVSAEAARQGRWEFLLTTAPLRVARGTGSPLNPIATF